MTNQRISTLLAYLGLLPFFLGALMDYVGSSLPGLPSFIVFATYSAIILSFLGGALWGQVLPQAEHRVALLIVSNVVALLSWAGLLLIFLLGKVALVLLLLGYLLVVLFEVIHKETLSGVIEWKYLTLRSRVTAIVVALHAIVLLNQH
ncbi:DUF3429 domain-containing protein [Kistimonas scapharcae]|uniref:DUF3429 domain-containing protein n=1 Tax=Kistimonas scapharcae TaxID=1036133 RepID=A0ABP8V4A7_9GAMM